MCSTSNISLLLQRGRTRGRDDQGNCTLLAFRFISYYSQTFLPEDIHQECFSPYVVSTIMCILNCLTTYYRILHSGWLI